MPHTIKPDRLANGRASGLQVSVQETNLTTSLKCRATRQSLSRHGTARRSASRWSSPDADPIAAAVRALMATRTEWTGTASDLQGALARGGRRRGRRTLVLPADLKDWVERLPPIAIKSRNSKAAHHEATHRNFADDQLDTGSAS
jgi:hypothetical protein